MGLGSKFFKDEEFARTEKTVCLTETPLEHVWMMCEDIEIAPSRAAYGLTFTKDMGSSKGRQPSDVRRHNTWSRLADPTG